MTQCLIFFGSDLTIKIPLFLSITGFLENTSSWRWSGPKNRKLNYRIIQIFSFRNKISWDKARNNDFSKIESRSPQSSFGRAFDLDEKVEKLDFLLFGLFLSATRKPQERIEHDKYIDCPLRVKIWHLTHAMSNINRLFGFKTYNPLLNQFIKPKRWEVKNRLRFSLLFSQ